MDVVKVDNHPVQPRYADWQATYQSHHPTLLALPQVTQGAVTRERALQWLRVACQLYPAAAVGRLLQQSAGFGAQDVRALVAFNRREYHPGYAASEVYQRKQLHTLPATDTPTGLKERALTHVLRAMLLKRYGLTRCSALEQAMALHDGARPLPWSLTQPGLVAAKGGQNLAFELQFDDKPDTIKPGDLVGPHYSDMVARSCGATLHHLHLVKAHVQPAFAESLVTLLSAAQNPQQTLVALIDNLTALPEEVLTLRVHPVQRQPHLYTEITEAGQHHWRQILAGAEPPQHLDPPMQLGPEQHRDYIDCAKAFLAATESAKRARDRETHAAEAVRRSLDGLDIGDNFASPYTAVQLRKVDHFNAEAAAAHLENQCGIHPAHLRDRTLNLDHLAAAYQRLGGDLTPFYEYGKANRRAIESVAEHLGIDLGGFMQREMVVLGNRKTRGPIHEAIQHIGDELERRLTDIVAQTANSPLMDQEALYPDGETHVQQQAALRIG